MEVTEVNQTPTLEAFSDSWLRRKPKFRTHQRVIAAPGVVGRITGMQQGPSSKAQETQWRYQVSSPTEYGVTLSWWDEEHLNPMRDRFTVILVEQGKEVEGCCAGTLEEAVEDVRSYMKEAHRQYHDYGRRMAVQIICCNTHDLEDGVLTSYEAAFSPNLC